MGRRKAQRLVRIVLLLGIALGVGFAVPQLDAAGGRILLWGVHYPAILPLLVAVAALVAFQLCAVMRPVAAAVPIGLGVLVAGGGLLLWYFLVVAEDPHYPTRAAHVAAVRIVLLAAEAYGALLVGAGVVWWRAMRVTSSGW